MTSGLVAATFSFDWFTALMVAPGPSLFGLHLLLVRRRARSQEMDYQSPLTPMIVWSLGTSMLSSVTIPLTVGIWASWQFGLPDTVLPMVLPVAWYALLYRTAGPIYERLIGRLDSRKFK